MLMEIVGWFMANWSGLLHAVMGAITGLIAVFMIIPGPQPEAFLQKCLDFLSKFSRK